MAEFQGKRWFRPLVFDTHILRRLRFPQEFSVEFKAYFFEPGHAELRVFLHTEEELKRGAGPDGPAQVYLTVGRTDKTDGFKLRKWVRPSGVIYQDVAARGYDASEGKGGFPPNRLHRIVLQVRGGNLTLFFDGERVATTPFQSEVPIVVISFCFLSRRGHELPYKDRPALLDGLRIAGYSRLVGRGAGGVFLHWALPMPKERLPQSFAQRSTYGGSVVLAGVGTQRTVTGTLVGIDVPANPFGSEEVSVRASGQTWSDFVQRLKGELEVVRQQGGSLVIIGDGGDAHTERERKLLANRRALAFAAWLAQQGIGNAQNLLRLEADNGKYEGVFYSPAEGSVRYEGITALQLERK